MVQHLRAAVHYIDYDTKHHLYRQTFTTSPWNKVKSEYCRKVSPFIPMMPGQLFLVIPTPYCILQRLALIVCKKSP